MKKLKLLPLCLSLCMLAGCGFTSLSEQKQDIYTATFFSMNTTMSISVYGEESWVQEAEELVYSLEQELSVTDERSEIYAINRDGEGPVSKNTAELLKRGVSLCGLTDGALDITIYPVLKHWGFTTGEYSVPDEETIAGLLNTVGYEKISIDGDTVSLPEGTQLDLGSIAKGYTGDKIVELWKERGATSGLVYLGGNVQTLGSKPDGSLWSVAIKDPTDPSNCFCYVQIADKCVITSGGYERYFEEDGKTYWHILDPETGYPADSGLLSVTIVGAEGVVCDAMSTAMFVMGLDKASELWKACEGFDAIFFTSDKEIYITEGIAGSFSTYGNYENAKVNIITK